MFPQLAGLDHDERAQGWAASTPATSIPGGLPRDVTNAARREYTIGCNHVCEKLCFTKQILAQVKLNLYLEYPNINSDLPYKNWKFFEQLFLKFSKRHYDKTILLLMQPLACLVETMIIIGTFGLFGLDQDYFPSLENITSLENSIVRFHRIIFILTAMC